MFQYFHRVNCILAGLFCLSLGFSTLTAAQTPVEEPVVLPSHWQTRLLQETVFGGDVFVVETGNADKPTVLLVHGLGHVGLEDWIPVVPALEQDFRVVLLDLPGFGRSGQPPGLYSPTNYARVIHQIRQQISPGPIHIVGHSLGAAISLRYAAMYPEAITSLTLIDAAGILTRTAFVKHSATNLIDGDGSAPLVEGIQTMASQYAGKIIDRLAKLPDPSRSLSQYQYLWGQMLENKTNTNAALALINEDFTTAVLTNSHRTSIIWGENDTVAPLRTGKLLAAQIPGAILATIPEADHVPMKSRPEELRRLLRAALFSEERFRELANEHAQPPTLICENQHGLVYSGIYTEIQIRNCSQILLQDVFARKMVIRNSQVEMENVQITTDKTALLVDGSTVVGTNADLRGNTGILAADSRLDLAGTRVEGSSIGIDVVHDSIFIFSISQMKSPGYTGYLHGEFRAPSGNLDAQMVKSARSQ